MPFEFKKMDIPDVILIKPKVFEDERGFFMETYKKEDFENAGIDMDFIQENHSKSKYGVLRGLHFQKEPYAQSKLVEDEVEEIPEEKVPEATSANYSWKSEESLSLFSLDISDARTGIIMSEILGKPIALR